MYGVTPPYLTRQKRVRAMEAPQHIILATTLGLVQSLRQVDPVNRPSRNF